MSPTNDPNPPVLRTDLSCHHRVTVEMHSRQTRTEMCEDGEQPRILLGMCGSVGGNLQAGLPQTAPIQLSHLNQEVFLELIPYEARGPHNVSHVPKSRRTQGAGADETWADEHALRFDRPTYRYPP